MRFMLDIDYTYKGDKFVEMPVIEADSKEAALDKFLSDPQNKDIKLEKVTYWQEV